MSHIEIHIDELVLYGFAPADRWRIGQAIEHALTRLFAEQGLPPALSMGGELARIDGGAFHVHDWYCSGRAWGAGGSGRVWRLAPMSLL